MQQQQAGRLQLGSDKSQDILTEEQLRSKYDRKIRRLMKIGHIEEKEMEALIQQLQSIINETDQEGSESDTQNERSNNDHRNDKNNTHKSRGISSYRFSIFF